ncbi:unnamed protein product [Colias eurytheme]|nr:unnamed protein product [Colias eurytheme]
MEKNCRLQAGCSSSLLFRGITRSHALSVGFSPGSGDEPILYIHVRPPEVCLFINKRERYSTALGAVCITNLKEANLEALVPGMEYKIQ